MRPNKNVLTTGEVARICSVAPRTVSKWFDSGQLRGYRIPGSKDRRIPLDQLVRFMRAHGIPLNGLDGGLVKVLVLDQDMNLCRALDTALTQAGGFAVAMATCAIEAGAIAQTFKPDVMLVDVSMSDVTPATVSRFVHSIEDLGTPQLIGTALGMTDAEGQALLQEGFDAYVSKPFDITTLVRLIEDKNEPVSVGNVS